jgi:hypothetical protein
MANKSRFTLKALNDSTGWLDLRSVTSTLSYIATGTFPGGTVVSIQYSNNEDFNKGTDFTTDPTTITGAVGPLQFPFGISRFVRFIMTGFAGGANVIISLAKAKANQAEQLIDVTAQPNDPGGPYSTI